MTLPASSPYVAQVQTEAAAKTVLELGYRQNRDVGLKRARAIASDLVEAEWTKGELDRAVRLIKSDSDLLKQISYDGTVTLNVFVQARARPEVMRGRLHDHASAVGFCRAYADEIQARDPHGSLKGSQGALGDVFAAVFVEGRDMDKPLWIFRDQLELAQAA